MLRGLGISLAAIIGLVLTLLGAGWVLLKTAFGVGIIDDVSRPIIADIVRKQLDAEISYAPIVGPLPGQLVVQDLTLSTDDEVWFESESIILAWRPWALLRGELSIDSIVIDTSTLHRLPDRPEKTGDAEPSEPLGSRDGDYFPIDVDLRDLIIDDFTLGPDILGTEQTVSLQAQGRVLKPRLRLSVHAQTDNGSDELFLNGDVDRDGLDLELALVSLADGAVAMAAKAEDRIELRLRAAGSYEQLEAELAAGLGRYGNVNGTLGRFAEQNNALRTNVIYQPGPILPLEVQDLLGERLRVVADIFERRGAADIELHTFSGAFGALAGSVNGTWGGGRSVSLDLDGALSEHVWADLGVGDLGGGFDLTADISRQDEGLRFDGDMTAGSLGLSIREGLSSDDVLFDGDVAVTVSSAAGAPDVLAPLLTLGAAATAKARLTSAQILTLNDLSARLGDGDDTRVLVRGDVEYDLQSPTLVTDLSLTIEPGALALLVPDAEASSDLTLDLRASGAIDDFAIAGSGAIPSGNFRGSAITPGRLDADFSGLPLNPTGRLLLEADDAYDLDLAVETTGSLVTLERLDAQFGALSLTGEGTFDHEALEGQGRINLDAGDRTRLVTGQVISGRLVADITNERAEDIVRFDIVADDLRLDDSAIGSLKIKASGPPEDIGFDVAASDIVAEDIFFHGLSSTGRLSLGDAREASIETLVVRLSEDTSDPREISLLRPTTARWGDGISLAPTRLAWLDDGIVTANAEISKTSWVAQVAAQRIAVPNTDTFISLQLNLDTNDTDPASFQVVAATEGEDERYAIRADGRWTGRDVLTEGVIIRSGRERLGTFDITAPLTLLRVPALGIAVPDTAVSASFNYDDSFAPFLAFAPYQREPVSGQLKADVEVTGPLSELIFSGQVALTETRVEDPEVGVTLLGLNGDIAFEGQGSSVSATVDLSGSGRERREGAVRLTGTVARTADTSALDLRLTTDRAQLARNAELELRVTSDLALQGSFEEATASGSVRIDELDFVIPDTQGGEDVPTFTPVNIVRTDLPPEVQEAIADEDANTPPLLLNLDLSVEARRGIFVRGRGIESEWAVDLDIGGTADDPKLRGSIDSVDGTLDLAGRSFTLTEGHVSFTPETSLDPTLDVQAEIVTGVAPDQITAVANVSGPSSQPTLTFTSNPTLPEEDVLALILFGRPATELGAAEALQLAQAAATLSGTGPFGGAGLTNGLRSGLGLDRLSYDPEGNSLTVGKYIAEGVYVSAVQGIGELGTAFSVVYEVSRFFSLETTLKSNGAQALSGNYKRDY
ncbi:MAG: translocation/assembly module TamB domain-containing protein [Pseudomonadota bacterium]